MHDEQSDPLGPTSSYGPHGQLVANMTCQSDLFLQVLITVGPAIECQLAHERHKQDQS